MKKSPLARILVITIVLLMNPGWKSVSARPSFARPLGTILYAKPGAAGDCGSWATACNLATALSNAAYGYQIWVAAGTYYPTSPSGRTATFQLKNGVAIYGGFPEGGGEWAERNWIANPTFLSGDVGAVGNSTDNSLHVVVGNGVNASAILDGFTITAGNANNYDPHDNGAGMYNNSASPTLTNLIFTGNTALGNGGGMYNYFSSPTLINVRFSNNTASQYGGGMYNYSNSPTLTNASFIGNTAYNGGGMYNENSNGLSLTNLLFFDNTANSGGGGLFNFFSINLNLTNITFSGNDADYGGGINNYQSSLMLAHVTMTNNTASMDGSGMYNDSSSPSIRNSIVYGNVTDQFNSDPNSFPTITYSVFQGGYTGEGNTSANPLLGSLMDNGGFSLTHALGEESSAIDVASSDVCPMVDQRGFSRPVDGDGDGTAQCDMGAYEFGEIASKYSLFLPIILRN